MPGILPMKVIKVGSNAQTRIAQACDRCRSKKIRCDGVRPCCSQCANVGFECKTSDKLSRRAFPRGYTESLEERVRMLEAEVRDLKEILDEKDEKIDMLSRIHSRSSQPIRPPPPPRTCAEPGTDDASSVKNKTRERDDLFNVQQSPCLTDGDTSNSYFSGTSSTRSLIDSFKTCAEANGRSTAEIDTSMLLVTAPPKVPDITLDAASTTGEWKAPPHLLADQLVNIFFQEWAPLFPVLHRPTFLSLYERYATDSTDVTDKAEIAQLNLVFGIAALSSGSRFSDELEAFEVQWKAAVGSILVDGSMVTLQVLVLAQLFCIQQGDLIRLLTYKGLSTALSARLGLHQSQKRFGLGTLTCETRKKVFWTLYTVDSFTAVMLGLPKHLKDDDIHCEYPVDADDEYVAERGFQPSLPGEPTRLSGALALFRASSILSKVLQEVYPTKPSYDLSLKKLSDLSDEIDGWYASLAPHLRLQFALDKPSAGTISSSSPILSLAYHYIHALIQRPAIMASLGRRSASSMIYMASDCKHIIQIIQLLDERGMSFAFSLSRSELLLLSGFGLLFQGLDLDRQAHSKILKDNAKMVVASVQALDRHHAPCANAFARVVGAFADVGSSKTEESGRSRHNSEGATTAEYNDSTRRQLNTIAARLESRFDPKPALAGARRASIHNISLHPPGATSQSQPSSQLAPYATSRSEPARSPINIFSRPESCAIGQSASPSGSEIRQSRLPNLDYLSFSDETRAPTKKQSSQPVKPETHPSDWERLLGNLDNGETNIFDACYGGPAIDVLLDVPPLGSHSTPAVNVGLGDTDRDMWTLCQVDEGQGHTGSIFSFSTEDALSSGEDLSADWASASSANGRELCLD